jgi:hypothetical protein
VEGRERKLSASYSEDPTFRSWPYELLTEVLRFSPTSVEQVPVCYLATGMIVPCVLSRSLQAVFLKLRNLRSQSGKGKVVTIHSMRACEGVKVFFLMAEQSLGGLDRLSFRGFTITHFLDTPHSVGLLCKRDQLVAETST